MAATLKSRLRATVVLGALTATLLVGIAVLEIYGAVKHNAANSDLAALVRDLARLSALTHEYALRREPRPLQQWRVLHAASTARVATRCCPEAAGQVHLRRLQRDLERIDVLFEALVGAREMEAPAARLRQEVLLERMLALGAQLAATAFTLQRELNEQRRRKLLVAGTIAVSLLIVGTLGLCFHLVRLSRNLSAGIGRLQTQALAVARGRRDVDMTPASDDELGDLTRHFAYMLESLRRTEALQQAAARSMADGLVIVDDEGRIRKTNPSVLRTFGYDDLEGRTLVSLASATARGGLEQAMAALSTERGAGAVSAVDVEMQRRDGSVFPVELALSQSQVNGQRYVTGVLRDVSQRREAAAAVTAARARTDLAIESVADGFVLFGPDERMVLCNRRYRRIYDKLDDLLQPGAEFGDLLNAGVWRGQYAQGEEAAGLVAARLRMRGDPSAVIEQELHDGRWIRIAEQRTPDGGRVGIETDITELKHRELELRRSNEELEKFAYVASHDLQEPLRKVRAFAERVAARYGERLDERGLSYLERTVDASARMSALINDLLEYSRVESDASAPESADLGRIVKRVLSDLEIRIDETGARLTVGELPVVAGDPRQLSRVFQNLISNALKFRREEAAPRIEIDCRSDCKVHSIAVRDNGIGFEQKFAERIFDVFQRLHGRSEYPGTGIGLAIVRKIIERHGGSISARSTPGEGTVFHLTFPVDTNLPVAQSDPAARAVAHNPA